VGKEEGELTIGNISGAGSHFNQKKKEKMVTEARITEREEMAVIVPSPVRERGKHWAKKKVSMQKEKV